RNRPSPADDQDPGVWGPPMNLCGEKNPASLSLWSPAPGALAAIRIGPKGGGRVVPDRQRAVAVQQGGQAVGVGQDAGDVGGGREGTDQQPARPSSSSRRTSLATAAVAPDPQKMTRSCAVPPTAWWITWRACSRRRVVWCPGS